MADRGLPVRYGFFPEPVAADAAAIVDDVLLAERLGFDLVRDPGPSRQRRPPRHDDAAGRARRADQPHRAVPRRRQPAVATTGRPGEGRGTLDLLSGGRVDLGLGAGAIWPAIAAYGGPRRTPREAVAALEEAITVLRLLWSDERAVRFAGDHYRLNGAHPGRRWRRSPTRSHPR